MPGWKDWVFLVVMGLIVLLTAVIGGISVWFVEDPFPYDANVLISSFALGMSLLAAAAIVLSHRGGNRLAWAALWVYPLFFFSHVAALGTYVPDLILALVASIALLLVWPRATRAPPSPIAA